jgi:putative hydrolase of the HAD superfamily
MTLQAAIFDLDGTLIDRTQAIRQYCACFLAEHPDCFLPTEPEEQTLACMESLYLMGLSKDVAWYDRMRHRLPWRKLPDPAFLDAHYRRCMARFVFPMRNLYETLGALRRHQVPMAILTNGFSADQRRKIDALQLGVLVPSIFVSEETGIAKPDPAAFYLALETLGTAASQTLFVGDDPSRDIEGARNAGLKTAWLREEHQSWPPALAAPDWTLENLSGLIPLFLQSTNHHTSPHQSLSAP